MRIKLNKVLFILVLAFSFSISSVNASHLMGGDITYDCVSGNDYKVTLRLYRDCNGIILGNTRTINFVSANCSQSFNVVLSLAQGPTIVTPLCPGEPDVCLTPSGTYGVERFIYEGIITMPQTCTDWKIYHNSCCRNGAITTLANAGGESFYIQSELDNTLSACNNSPDFAQDPIFYACVGSPVSYSHGVSDIDNDSLVFSLMDCFGSGPGSGIVTYSTGFSGSMPLAANNLAIDPSTGVITFTPTLAQVAVICVLVEEYRNGAKIGEVMRDIQFGVLSCVNTPPVLSGFNGTADSTGTTGNYTLTTCVGNQVCFDIASYDAEGDDIFAMIDNTLTNAQVTIDSTGAFPIATVCWTPTATDTGTNIFSVRVFDDACPIVGEGIYGYTIYVQSGVGIASNDTTIQVGDSVQLTTTAALNGCSFDWTDNAGFTCSNCSSVNVSPTTTTTYYLTGSCTGGCTINDSITITVQSPKIQGIISRADSLPLTNSWVFLMDVSLHTVDSTVTNGQGAYAFDVTLNSTYYVYTIPDSVTQGDQLQTYYNTQITVQDADPIVTTTPITQVDFYTFDFSILFESGIIGGVIWNETLTETLDDVRIILTENNQIVSATHTNSNGQFVFNGLGLGNYHLWVDQTGINNGVAPMIALVMNDDQQDSLLFKLTPTHLELVSVSTQPQIEVLSKFEVYPNPASSSLMIDYSLEKQATIQIEVLNVLGKKQKTIFEGERKIGDHRYELSGELDNFTSGIYFIRLIINNQAIIRKIILQK